VYTNGNTIRHIDAAGAVEELFGGRWVGVIVPSAT
jgi:hypothetical protein